MSNFEKLKVWVVHTKEEWQRVREQSQEEYKKIGHISREHELLCFFDETYEHEIKNLEESFNIKYPQELKMFNMEIGWGCLFTNDLDKYGIYQLISPARINELYFGDNQEDEEYEDEEYDIYREIRGYYTRMLINEHKLAFCEYDDSTMLTISLNEQDEQGRNPIYFEDIKIANSIQDFIDKLYYKRDYFS